MYPQHRKECVVQSQQCPDTFQKQSTGVAMDPECEAKRLLFLSERSFADLNRECLPRGQGFRTVRKGKRYGIRVFGNRYPIALQELRNYSEFLSRKFRQIAQAHGKLSVVIFTVQTRSKQEAAQLPKGFLTQVPNLIKLWVHAHHMIRLQPLVGTIRRQPKECRIGSNAAHEFAAECVERPLCLDGYGV